MMLVSPNQDKDGILDSCDTVSNMSLSLTRTVREYSDSSSRSSGMTADSNPVLGSTSNPSVPGYKSCNLIHIKIHIYPRNDNPLKKTN